MAIGDRRRFTIKEISLDIEAVENSDGEFEVTDDAGSRWTGRSYRNADGSVADTFGPGRRGRRLPTIVRYLRALRAP